MYEILNPDEAEEVRYYFDNEDDIHIEGYYHRIVLRGNSINDPNPIKVIYVDPEDSIESIEQLCAQCRTIDDIIEQLEIDVDSPRYLEFDANDELWLIYA